MNITNLSVDELDRHIRGLIIYKMNDKGLSYRDVDKLTGVTYSSISDYLSGKVHSNTGTVIRLLYGLDLIEYVFTPDICRYMYEKLAEDENAQVEKIVEGRIITLIKCVMAQKHVRQAQLSKYLNVSRQRIEAILNGRGKSANKKCFSHKFVVYLNILNVLNMTKVVFANVTGKYNEFLVVSKHKRLKYIEDIIEHYERERDILIEEINTLRVDI